MSVTFESQDGDPIMRKVTLTPSTMTEWKSGFDVKYLQQPDRVDVCFFSDLVDGGQYRAVCNSDGWKHRDQVDDAILEIEAAEYVLSAVTEFYPNAHVHHNVQLKDTSGKKLMREYDAIVHGHELFPTVGFLVEAKYVPHPNDIGKLLDRATELERWLQAKKVHPASEGTLMSKRKPLDLSHLFNIQRVVPVLAGKLFHQVNLDECVSRGVLPLYPSGARYAIKGLSALLKLT